MLSGVIQTDRNGPEACSDELLSQLARAEHGSLPKPILKTPWVTCYARNQPTVDLWVLTDEKGRTIVVCGFLAVSGDARPALQQQLARDAESSLSDLPGIWNALIHDPHEKRTSLASDRLGVAWLYVARSGTRLIFSSRFDVCARAAPARTLNMDASLATLELGYPPANQTCLEQVQLLPPGAVCKIDEAGYQAPEREAIRYGSEFAGLEIEEKMEALDRAYDQALAAWCPEPDKRYLLSLSGGYDSRAVLGAMLRKNRRVHCASFGRIRTPDCVKARRLAESLGLEHSVFRIPDPSWDDLSRTFSTSGGIGGTPFVQGWSEPWLKFVQSRNDNLVIGFLGGVLTGSQAGRSKEQAWLEYWDQWSFDGGFVDSPLMREEARAEIRPAIHRETMRLPNAQVAFEYQNILHVNLYTRQRRCIGIQPYVIGRYVRPITFLYHPAVLSFWSNVAFEDVTKQSLYLAHSRSRFPQIFAAPAKPPFSKRLAGAAINALAGHSPASVRKFLKSDSYDQTALWCRFRAPVTRLIDQHWDFVNSVFYGDRLLAELKAFPKSPQLTTMHLSRLVGLLILLGAGREERLEAARTAG